MTKKLLKHKPSPITVAGIYARILGGALGIPSDTVADQIDIMPSSGLISINLPADWSSAAEPGWWEPLDTAASGQLGGAVTTTVAGGVAVVEICR